MWYIKGEQMSDKVVIWEGDSLEVLKEFPEDIKQNIGLDLRRVQTGLAPLDSKPMKSIDKGVYELRDSDKSNWYRVIYFTKIKDTVYILHSFTKKTKKTPQKELSLATERLKNLKARLQEEKKWQKKQLQKKK